MAAILLKRNVGGFLKKITKEETDYVKVGSIVQPPLQAGMLLLVVRKALLVDLASTSSSSALLQEVYFVQG